MDRAAPSSSSGGSVIARITKGRKWPLPKALTDIPGAFVDFHQGPVHSTAIQTDITGDLDHEQAVGINEQIILTFALRATCSGRMPEGHGSAFLSWLYTFEFIPFFRRGQALRRKGSGFDLERNIL